MIHFNQKYEHNSMPFISEILKESSSFIKKNLLYRNYLTIKRKYAGKKNYSITMYIL